MNISIFYLAFAALTAISLRFLEESFSALTLPPLSKWTHDQRFTVGPVGPSSFWNLETNDWLAFVTRLSQANPEQR